MAKKEKNAEYAKALKYVRGLAKNKNYLEAIKVAALIGAEKEAEKYTRQFIEDVNKKGAKEKLREAKYYAEELDKSKRKPVGYSPTWQPSGY